MVSLLLFISYAIIAAAIMIVPPRMMGVDAGSAELASMIFFLFAWQLTQLVMGQGGKKSTSGNDDELLIAKVEALEEMVKKHQSAIRDAQADIEKSTVSEEDTKKMQDEMKMLQTLLNQVVKKENAIASKGPRPTEAPAATRKKVLEITPQDIKDLESGKITQQELAARKQKMAAEMRADAKVADKKSAAPVKKSAASPAPADQKPREKAPSKAAPAPTVPRPAPANQKVRVIDNDEQLLKVIKSSLSENRVDLYLQPIVGLPSRKSAHFECFSRVRDEDGNIVLPRQYMEVAEKSGLVGTLDNLLLFRLIQLVRKLGRRRPGIRFFCNMSKYSLNDQEFFPQFVDFMTGNEEFRDRMVFEIPEDDFNQLSDNVLAMLMSMGRRGFQFSLDNVSQPELDIPILAKHNFKYVKISMERLMQSFDEETLPDYIARLRRHNIMLVGSHMENEAEVLKALDCQVELAQGYLFGEPMSSVDLDRSF